MKMSRLLSGLCLFVFAITCTVGIAGPKPAGAQITVHQGVTTAQWGSCDVQYVEFDATSGSLAAVCTSLPTVTTASVAAWPPAYSRAWNVTVEVNSFIAGYSTCVAVSGSPTDLVFICQ